MIKIFKIVTFRIKASNDRAQIAAETFDREPIGYFPPIHTVYTFSANTHCIHMSYLRVLTQLYVLFFTSTHLQPKSL